MEVTALITKLDHLCKEKTDLLGEVVEAHESRVNCSHATFN